MTVHTAAICLGIGLAAATMTAGLWWLLEHSGARRRLAAAGACLADARLLFPFSDREADALRHVAEAEAWANPRDMLERLAPGKARSLPGSLPRTLGTAPPERLNALRNTSQIERGTPATVEVIARKNGTWHPVELRGSIAGVRDTGIYFEPDEPAGPLHKDAPVTVNVRRDGDALYSFRSALTEDCQGRLLRIRHPEHLSRVQQRSWARVPVGRLTEFGHVPQDELAGNLADGGSRMPAPHVARGLLMDLSGGGAAIRSTSELQPNDLVTLDLDRLSRSSTERPPAGAIVGRVIDCTAQTSGERPWRLTRIEFINLSDEERRCIVRYVDHKLLSALRPSA